MMAAKGKEVPSITATAKDLFKNQSFSGFYRGIDSNIARAMVLNGTKMGVYDQAKGYVVETRGLSKTSLSAQFLSAVTAGFFHDGHRVSLRHDSHAFDEPTCRRQNIQQCSGLHDEDCPTRRAADFLAWFHAYLVAVCAHHHLAVDYFRANAWNDGYEGAVVE